MEPRSALLIRSWQPFLGVYSQILKLCNQLLQTQMHSKSGKYFPAPTWSDFTGWSIFPLRNGMAWFVRIGIWFLQCHQNRYGHFLLGHLGGQQFCVPYVVCKAWHVLQGHAALNTKSCVPICSLMLPHSLGSQGYFKRMTQLPQMDIEYAMWQLLYLCINPKKVSGKWSPPSHSHRYKNTALHKRIADLRSDLSLQRQKISGPEMILLSIWSFSILLWWLRCRTYLASNCTLFWKSWSSLSSILLFYT